LTPVVERLVAKKDERRATGDEAGHVQTVQAQAGQ
jgi:hypothetical protein